ncbi:glycosyltransferase family 39 protein [Patescibacteria group bacterium]|nr:glycosyltransferase family 39 protein [Patescibacteria group bacterium]
MDKKITIFLLFVVVGIFLFFHFYNIDKRIGFGWDQESYSYQVANIIKNHKLTLIGPRSADIKGFFLGPYFIYLLIPFYLLTHLHPFALTIFVVVYNLLFLLASLILLTKIFDFYTAILFLLFWSINPQLVSYDIVPWNPIFIALGFIICWYLLKKILKNNKIKDWALLGLLSGIMINFHFSFIFVLVFNGTFILIMETKNKFKDWKKIITALATFGLTFLPLVLFDLRHDFLNAKLFIDFFFGAHNQVAHDIYTWMPVFNNMIKPVIVLSENSATITLYLLILVMIAYSIIKKKDSYQKTFFYSALVTWLIFPVFFTIYSKRPSEYYFLFAMPLIYLSIICFFSDIKLKYLSLFLAFLLLILNFGELKSITGSYPFGLYYKDAAVKRLATIVKNKTKLNVTIKVPLGENNGYNYLIEYYRIKQSGNFNDPLIEIMVPPQPGNIKIGTIGLKIPKELK